MSLVRLNCNTYALKEEQRKLCSEIWSQLSKGDEKFPYLEEKLVDIEEIPAWVAEIEAISIKPIPKIRFTSPEPKFSTGNINEVREFIKTVNQIVMPGFDLLRYGAIRVETDSCTEVIQDLLDAGWRIIAVLPQANQRRPDYVMVRETKP